MTKYRTFQNDSERDGLCLVLAVVFVFAAVRGTCWCIGKVLSPGGAVVTQTSVRL